MLTAVQRTVNKDGPNKGRTFWTCPNSEKARCGFFEWDDAGPNGAGSGGNTAPARGQFRNDTQGNCFKVRSYHPLWRAGINELSKV